MADQYIRYPAATALTQADIEAALEAVFPTDVLTAPIYHNAATTAITGSYAAAGGGAGTIPTGTKKIQISSTIGTPLNFGIGANSGAAVSKINLVSGGGPVYIEYTFVTGDLLFVRTLDGTTVSIGHFVCNFLG